MRSAANTLLMPYGVSSVLQTPGKEAGATPQRGKGRTDVPPSSQEDGGGHC